MTPQELADILFHMRRDAPNGEISTMVHLFGIRYVDEIGECGASVNKIVELSNVPDSYYVEVRQGMRVARYVSLRPDWDSRI